MAQVTSGGITTDFYSRTRFYVDWQRTGYNIENNYSPIAWQAGVELTGNDHWYSNAIRINQVYVNGVEVATGVVKSNVSGAGKYQMASGTINVPHNEDGNKSFEVAIFGWLYGNHSLERKWIYFELPTIPRTSNVSLSASNVVLGNSVTVNTNRASSSFTHALYYQIDGGSWTTIATNVGASYSWTVPKSIANSFTSSTSKTINVICETYNGGTYIGTSQTQLTVSISSDMKPSTPSLTVSETAGRSLYIETISNVRVQSSASGSYGSSISQYKVEFLIGGTVKQTQYGADVTFNTNNLGITADTTATIRTTVTDSRNQSNSNTTTITIKRYIRPYIMAREAYRCYSDGTRNVSGNCLHLYWMYHVQSFATASTTVRYRKKNGSWTNVSLANAQTKIISNIEANSSYEVQFTVGDNYSSSATGYENITTAYKTLSFRNGGNGVALGKVAEEDLFDVNMKTKFRDTITLRWS